MVTTANQISKENLSNFQLYFNDIKSLTKDNSDYKKAEIDIFINQLQYATYLLYKLGKI